MMKIHSPILILAALLSLLTACTSAPYADRSKPLDDATTLQKPLSLDASKLLPLSPESGAFLPTLTDDLEEGKRVPFTFDQMPDGTWRWALKKLRVIYYRTTPAGIVIVREDDLDESVAVTYEPGILVLPVNATSAAPTAGSSKMVVRNLDSQSVNNKGQCDYTVEVLGRHNIWTPRGVVDAVIVRNTRKIALKFVNVDVKITTAYSAAPLTKNPPKGTPMGQVGEHIHQVIKPLGLFEDESTEELRVAQDTGKPVFNPHGKRGLAPSAPTTEPAR